MIDTDIELLKGIANQLRIHSITATTAAGSGHPTSCCSAADVVAALFFGHMRYDAKNPHYHNNDRFILSKGHAAPLLYAAWAETGLFPAEELLKLRKFGSDLEGHPTPRLPFVDVATGSLGQGLSVASAWRWPRGSTSLITTPTFCSAMAKSPKARFGRPRRSPAFTSLTISSPSWTRTASARARPRPSATILAFIANDLKPSAGGWKTLTATILRKFQKCSAASGLNDQPLAIIAKTYKGAGVSFLQDKDGWHGKPLSKEEAAKAIAELQPSSKSGIGVPIPAPNALPAPNLAAPASYPPLSYKIGDSVATREAYGNALARMGEVDQRIVAVDGDTKNSTYADKFFKKFPDRSIEGYIAEQNMVGVATGFGARGKVPFASTFACFFTRAVRSDPRRGHFAGESETRRLARRREHRRGRPVPDGTGRSGDDARGCRQHGVVSGRRGRR